MAKIAKIAISLDRELLEAIEHQCRTTGQSRSEFFRCAAEQALAREHAAIERYVRGYQRQPETAEEIAVAQIGTAVLAQEPWE